MKRLILVGLLVSLATLSACKKKEDAPGPRTPHIAGTWAGTGTDDSIGFYNLSVDLVQSADSASGTFSTVSAFATTSGNVLIGVGPAGGSNVGTLTMTRIAWSVTTPPPSRTCAGVMTLSQPTFMTDSAISFYYTVTDCAGGESHGGANLHKVAGTN